MAAAMAGVSIVAISPVRSDPGDIFAISAPAIGAAPPKAAALGDGDASVSTQTGALTYSYPIGVPPGRHGMQPQLALSYSSQGPIYGTVAAGWSLSGIHLISQDTSNGRVAAHRYQSTLSGGRPLVQVGSTGGPVIEFRAKNDASWTRYHRTIEGENQVKWRAYTTDGTIWHFGEVGHGTCAPFTENYAPLTRVVDKFGNTIEYFYKDGPLSDCRIDYIRWGKTTSGLPHFAQVVFNYAEMPSSGSSAPSCVSNIPIGSQISWRTGSQMATGTTRIISIVATAFAPGAPGSVVHTRQVALSYDSATESCWAMHAPYRSLTSIQETAWGSDSPQVTLPAVTFSYGSAQFGSGALAWPNATTTTLPWQPVHPADGASAVRFNLGWGYRFLGGFGGSTKMPTVEEMMLDIDGDGLLDRVTHSPPYGGDYPNNVTRCRAAWQKNLGRNAAGTLMFAAEPRYIELPTLKWASPNSYAGGAHAGHALAHEFKAETCSLNYQQTGYSNSVESLGGFTCPGSTCLAAGYCENSKHDCSTGKAGTNEHAILAYRWMDLDGDGLVDLVASPTKGGLARYHFFQGNKPGAVPEPPIFGTFSGNYAECPGNSLPGSISDPYTMCGGLFPWFFYKNRGDGTFGEPPANGQPWPHPTRIVYQTIPLETAAPDSSVTSYPVGSYQGAVDLDGDGFADGVKSPSTGSWTLWQLWSNDQTGRFTPYDQSDAFSFITSTSKAIHKSVVPLGTYAPRATEGLIDLHGDGLVDHWVENGSGALVSINDGVGFRHPAGISTSIRPANDGTGHTPPNCSDCWAGGSISKGYRRDVSRTLDLDLDGRTDVAQIAWWSGAWRSYLNVGGNFGIDVFPIGWEPSLDRIVVVSKSSIGGYPGAPPPENGERYSWEIRSDMIDLDGDGIPEGVDFTSNVETNPAQFKLSRVVTPSQPPRLLKTINNGRGASTEISYAPVADNSVVTQRPELGKTMPQTQWVVKTITTTDTVANPQTVSTTTYKYEDPEFGPGDAIRLSEGERAAFRGFGKVIVTQPSGARVRDTVG